MKLNIHLYILVTITIFSLIKYAKSESFCSTDPEGSCSIPSKNNIDNPFQGIQKLLNSVYSRYAKKIKDITELKDKKRNREFSISADSVIEKIDSNNYQLLTNGTWLVQIYSPWCPYSLHFQRTWKRVVTDVKKISEVMSTRLPLNEEKYTEEQIKEKDNNIKEDSEEIKMKKRLIMKNLRFAQIDANESIDVAALLEVKGFPTIKMLHKGNVVTYTNSTSYERLVKFALDDWMNQEWYNRLPKKPSKLYQMQIKFSLTVYKIMYYLDLAIFVPFKYLTFALFIYMAYNINILGKIRYGLIHVRQYFSAFVPEILELE